MQETKTFFQIENVDCAFKFKSKRLHPGYADPARSFDELKLVRVVSGGGVWHIGDRDYAVQTDDIIVLSPVDERHISEITDDALVIEYVEFMPMTIHPIQDCADFFFRRPNYFSNVLPREGEYHRKLVDSFAELRRELSGDKIYQKEYIVHLLMGMVIMAARLCGISRETATVGEDQRYHTICRIMVYIKEHLSEDLSRERLAKMYGFSPSYLSRLFREYSGVCLQDYIVKCRVQKAIFLLKSGEYGVLDAALESGFRSSSGFYRAFHKTTGSAPTEFVGSNADGGAQNEKA